MNIQLLFGRQHKTCDYFAMTPARFSDPTVRFRAISKNYLDRRVVNNKNNKNLVELFILYLTYRTAAHGINNITLVNHGPSQQSSKKEYKPWNEVLPQDTTHLLQRPCYQRGSLCQDPAGNWTTRKPDHRKETQTAVSPVHQVWPKLSCKAQ